MYKHTYGIYLNEIIWMMVTPQGETAQDSNEAVQNMPEAWFLPSFWCRISQPSMVLDILYVS